MGLSSQWSRKLVLASLLMPRGETRYGFLEHSLLLCGSQGGPSGKELPANAGRCKETGVRSLGQVDPLEEGTATHSSFLAWRISWTEESGQLQSIGSQRVAKSRTQVKRLSMHTRILLSIPLQSVSQP